MTLRKLPPNPSGFRNLDTWAQQIFEYLKAQAPISSVVAPTPLLLAHRTASLDDRAAEDGILLFDTEFNVIAYSHDGEWHAVADWQWVADRFVFAAYGGMYDDAVIFASLGAAWTPVTNYDGISIVPRLVTLDQVAGTFTFDYDGVYELGFAINWAHNESNQGRETGIRLYNVTDGIAGAGGSIFIGRNQPGTAVTFMVPFEVAEADKGKAFRVEMGNGDSITSITGSVDLWVKSISEWREDTNAQLSQ